MSASPSVRLPFSALGKAAGAERSTGVLRVKLDRAALHESVFGTKRTITAALSDVRFWG
jgi:hypothetical protein